MDRNQVAVHFVGLSAVALRKESVDRNNPYRNILSMLLVDAAPGRSPQGERG